MEPLEFDLQAPTPPACGHTRLTLRRLHAGELDDGTRHRIDTHLKDCLDCQAILAELSSDEAAFRVHIPKPRFMADHEKRVGRAQSERTGVMSLWKLLVGGGLTTALALGTALFVMMPAPSPQEVLTARIKGGGIGFLLRTPDGVRPGRDGEALRAGDQIQFFVKTPDDADLVVLGVDGKGAVSLYHAGRVPHSDGRAVPLPDSVVLDDAVGPERFFAVYARGLKPEDVRAAAQKAAEKLVADGADLRTMDSLPLELPAEKTGQSSVHIVKLAR